MKLARYENYAARLYRTIGLAPTCSFVLVYIKLKLFPSPAGTLAHVPVGPYAFYFPSLPYFEGLFTEIFFSENYYLATTREPIHVIDCGANIGVSLLYILIRAPHARVQCFEPNPAARAVLEHNVRANNWEHQVKIFPYALGAQAGQADFFINATEATTSGGSLKRYTKGENHRSDTYRVRVVPLSEYVHDPVDLLKIDIEGAELDVFTELQSKNVFPKIRAIQFEYHYLPECVTHPVSKLLVLLESEGFKTFIKSTTEPNRMIGRTTLHTYMVFAWR